MWEIHLGSQLSIIVIVIDPNPNHTKEAFLSLLPLFCFPLLLFGMTHQRAEKDNFRTPFNTQCVTSKQLLWHEIYLKFHKYIVTIHKTQEAFPMTCCCTAAVRKLWDQAGHQKKRSFNPDCRFSDVEKKNKTVCIAMLRPPVCCSQSGPS